MFRSSLFHSLQKYRKKFLKYSVLQGNTMKIFGCLWEFLICGSQLWVCDGCSVKMNLQSKYNRPFDLLWWRYSSPNFLYNLSQEERLTALVIASTALHCTKKSHRNMHFWFLLNFLLMPSLFDVLASSLSFSCVFSRSVFQVSENILG